MSNVSHYLLLDRIEIEGANALASPMTYGFPAITGFMGAIHALNRKLVESGFELDLSGVLIACHDLNVQRYRPHRYADYTFNQSRNPIKKDGGTASIIEEGKVHLTVSLVVEVSASRAAARDLEDDQARFEQSCYQTVLCQRMAGGSVHAIKSVQLLDRHDIDELPLALYPAFVLMDARADLIEITQTLQASDHSATALDALLDVATLHHEPTTADSGAVTWHTRSARTGRGWLVPMPVGYQGLAPAFKAGELENSRNPEYPSQYVEAIYSLGKWVFPNRLPEDFSACFWRYQQTGNLYLANQTNTHRQGE
jgi:CRISPR-associated protein Csy2